MKSTKAKNTDRSEEHVKLVKKDIPRYELRVNGQTSDLDNNIAEVEKLYTKSNSRSVQMFELSPGGMKKLIKNKTNAATFSICCGGVHFAAIYTEALNRKHSGVDAFKAWEKEAFKPKQQKKAA